jgi:hypothetical protein
MVEWLTLIAPSDLHQRLACLPSGQGLCNLVRGELWLATEPSAPRLSPRES